MAGGYSGGSEEYVRISKSNGLSGEVSELSAQSAGGAGSGYFEKAKELWTMSNGEYREVAGPIGGGGVYTKSDRWSFSFSGDGGVAGKGGTIKVSPTTTVEAYNGNKYTDNNDMVEYCPIYIQNGELLEITTSLGFWTDQDNNYYSALFEKNVDYTTTWGTPNGNDHVAKLRDRSTDENLKTKYINPKTNSCQGVGSGAGYIELDNGTFDLISVP